MCNCKNYNLGLFFASLGRCGSLIVHAYIYKDNLQEGMVVLNFDNCRKLTSLFHAAVVNGVAQISPVLYDLGC